MYHFLPAPLRGLISILLLAINTLIWCWPLFFLALIKLLLPIKSLQTPLRNAMVWIAEQWIACNSLWINNANQWQLNAQGTDAVDLRHSYLVTSNHASWTDIFMLQQGFNRSMPFFRFFLKQELIWVPLIGLCWWALEFPFMKRYSAAYLAKHPEKKGQDLATTRRACARFKGQAVAIVNFLEGSRFTEAKHRAQNSPYRHLLKPKAGGVALVVDAMGEQLHALVDVTLYYPGKTPSFLDMLCGRLKQVEMHVQLRDIPREFIGRDYAQDEIYRAEFQRWVNTIWQGKDALISQLEARYQKQS